MNRIICFAALAFFPCILQAQQTGKGTYTFDVGAAVKSVDFDIIPNTRFPQRVLIKDDASGATIFSKDFVYGNPAEKVTFDNSSATQRRISANVQWMYPKGGDWKPSEWKIFSPTHVGWDDDDVQPDKDYDDITIKVKYNR